MADWEKHSIEDLREYRAVKESLGTLPEETFADGVAEAIKYGAILDPELFGLLVEGDFSVFVFI